MISYKKWKNYEDDLNKLHYMANMYRMNGHFEADVLSPYSILYDLIVNIEHEPKEKKQERG